jgi:hypothetical protein
VTGRIDPGYRVKRSGSRRITSSLHLLKFVHTPNLLAVFKASPVRKRSPRSASVHFVTMDANAIAGYLQTGQQSARKQRNAFLEPQGEYFSNGGNARRSQAGTARSSEAPFSAAALCPARG